MKVYTIFFLLVEFCDVICSLIFIRIFPTSPMSLDMSVALKRNW